jgi:uncharacterized coiled-coil protein SlyX
MNKYINGFCHHSLLRNSCQKCNEVQPFEYNQFETRIKNLETQLKHEKGINKSLEHLVLEQEKKIVELATELAYANRTLEHLTVIEPQQEQEPQYFEPQYLYMYNDMNNNKTWMSPTIMLEGCGWVYMGKVRVEK